MWWHSHFLGNHKINVPNHQPDLYLSHPCQVKQERRSCHTSVFSWWQEANIGFNIWQGGRVVPDNNNPLRFLKYVQLWKSLFLFIAHPLQISLQYYTGWWFQLLWPTKVSFTTIYGKIKHAPVTTNQYNTQTHPDTKGHINHKIIQHWLWIQVPAAEPNLRSISKGWKSHLANRLPDRFRAWFFVLNVGYRRNGWEWDDDVHSYVYWIMKPHSLRLAPVSSSSNIWVFLCCCLWWLFIYPVIL